MRLISAYLDGYRRFGTKTKINLDGKLIALVGPNEAGKTTILTALSRFQDEGPISARERTRPSDPADSATALEALWLIEPDDLSALTIPHGSEPPRWLNVRKTFAGPIETDLLPPLRRDRRARERMVSELRRIQASKWLASFTEDADGLEVAAVEKLAELLESNEETLPAETVAWIRNVADQIAAFNAEAPKYAATLPDDLRALAEHEDAPHPTEAAKDVLRSRIPQFITFEIEARQLASTYDLQEVAEKGPSVALRNLAKLAELDLGALHDAIAIDDRGLAAEQMASANHMLQTRLDEAWGQSTVEPLLTNDDFVLRIFVRTENGKYHDIAERSDGLRAFLALVAFTNEYAAGPPPILLIDEAEIHLHYDAQADLVQMLGRQQQAAQVIYTTHSAGCLPQDLGTGVRLVEPSPDSDRSVVTNWPWEKEGGFGPLLLGMGAATMAFVPTRAAVIAEGAGEVILLPTLLKQATGLEALPYQVAPGAAEASSDAIERYDRQGSKVAWLVDGDTGGADNRRHVGSKIPTERIVTLGGQGSRLSVEDLLNPEIYAHAVNEELRRSRGQRAAQLSPDDLPQTGRPTFVEAWCQEHELPAPNKGSIAHRVADERSIRKLGSGAHDDLLRGLHTQLTALLDIKPDK